MRVRREKEQCTRRFMLTLLALDFLSPDQVYSRWIDMSKLARIYQQSRERKILVRFASSSEEPWDRWKEGGDQDIRQSCA